MITAVPKPRTTESAVGRRPASDRRGIDKPRLAAGGRNSLNGKHDNGPLARMGIAGIGLADAVEPIEIEQIHVAENSRKTFNEGELLSLMESVKQFGVLQNLVVRKLSLLEKPELSARNINFELVAGERRLRAARMAGLKTVPCLVRTMTADEAADLRAIENAQRVELNSIEKAHELVRLLERKNADGSPRTQADVAAMLGTTQGNVANQLRLLELPEAWRKRLIAQEITPRHARALLPWKDVPEILAAVEKDLKRQLKSDTLESVSVWEETIEQCAFNAGEPLTGQTYDSIVGNHLRWAVELTDELRRELRIIQVQCPWNHQEPPVERALNKKLAKKLADAALMKARTAAISKQGKSGGKKSATSAGAPAKKETPAELKAKAKKQQEIFAAHLAAWRTDWLRYLCAKALRSGLANGGDLVCDRVARMIFVLLATDADAYYRGGTDVARRGEVLSRVLDALGVATKKNGRGNCKTWPMLEECEPDNFEDAVTEAAAAYLYDWLEECPGTFIPPEEVEGIARLLGVQLGEAWEDEQAGPLTERYFALHSKQQLVALAKQGLVHLEPNKPKEVMLRVAQGACKRLPAEIGLVAAGPKSKPKPAAAKRSAKGAAGR